MAQHEIKSARIRLEHLGEAALDHKIDAAVPHVLLVAQVQGAHHRRQRERHESGHQDGHGHGDGKFTKESTDDPAHEEERNEHRHQRQADGHNSEADLRCPLQGSLFRRHSRLNMAVDVFQHDDGIVDHETHCNRETHEGKVVEAVANDIHERRGAE